MNPQTHLMLFNKSLGCLVVVCDDTRSCRGTGTRRTRGCPPGAVGAVIGELVAEWYADTTGYDALRIAANDPNNPNHEVLQAQLAEQKHRMAGIAQLAAVGGTAVLLQSGAEQLQLAKMTANNAVVNNRQLHVDERVLAKRLTDKAQALGLTKPDGSAYTQADIEHAMRNSSRGDESITQGMLADPNNPKAITDTGAAFTLGSDGKTLVQVNPDGSNLNPNNIDPQLAAYIVQETGGANTPYRDLYNRVQTANAAPATNPNAHLNTVTPNANGAVTAEAAAGLLPVRSENRSVEQIDRDLKTGVCSWAVGGAVNSLIPGSAVLKPLTDSAGKITGWVAQNSFDQATAAGSSAMFCRY